MGRHEKLHTYWSLDPANELLFADMVRSAATAQGIGWLESVVHPGDVVECFPVLIPDVLMVLVESGANTLAVNACLEYVRRGAFPDPALLEHCIRAGVRDGRFHACREILTSSPQVSIDPWAQLALARCHYELGDPQSAASVMLVYVDAHPDDLVASDRLCVYLWDADLEAEALARAQTLITETVRWPGAATVLLESLDPAMAKYIADWRTEEFVAQPRVLQALSGYLFAMSKFDEAMPFAMALQGTDNFDVDTLLVCVLGHLIAENVDGARQMVQAYSPGEGEQADYLCLEALTQLPTDQVKAGESIARALDIEPDHAMARCMARLVSDRPPRSAQEWQAMMSDILKE